MRGRYEFLAQDWSSMASRLPPPCSIRRRRWRQPGVPRQQRHPQPQDRRNRGHQDRPRARFLRHVRPMWAHVPRDSVLEAAERVRQARPDLIVTIGGGTPIDTGQDPVDALAEDIRTAEELGAYRIQVLDDGSKRVPAVKAPPIRQIVVPTTLSGAEFSNLSGCSDRCARSRTLYRLVDRRAGGHPGPAPDGAYARMAVAVDRHARDRPRGRDDLLA